MAEVVAAKMLSLWDVEYLIHVWSWLDVVEEPRDGYGDANESYKCSCELQTVRHLARPVRGETKFLVLDSQKFSYSYFSGKKSQAMN